MTKLESLKKNSHFEIVLKNKIINNDLFTIYRAKNFIKENKKNKKLYISFVMRKKVGNAVKRNRIKRKLKSIVQKLLKTNGEINSKHDLTIIDFNRFNIQQTFSMAMASNNQHSFSIAGLTNNISYLWNKNLTLDADITLYTSQFPSYNQTNLINEVDLSYNAGITYQPSKNLFLTLRFQKIPYYQKYQTNSPFNMRFIQ